MKRCWYWQRFLKDNLTRCFRLRAGARGRFFEFHHNLFSSIEVFNEIVFLNRNNGSFLIRIAHEKYSSVQTIVLEDDFLWVTNY